MRTEKVKCYGIWFTVHYKIHSPKEMRIKVFKKRKWIFIKYKPTQPQLEIVKMVYRRRNLYEMIDPYKMLPILEKLKKKEFPKLTN